MAKYIQSKSPNVSSCPPLAFYDNGITLALLVSLLLRYSEEAYKMVFVSPVLWSHYPASTVMLVCSLTQETPAGRHRTSPLSDLVLLKLPHSVGWWVEP